MVCVRGILCGKDAQEIQIVRDTESKGYQSLNKPHRKCLELMGRLLRIQHSRRIFVVVYVPGILGGKDAPRNTNSKIYQRQEIPIIQNP